MRCGEHGFRSHKWLGLVLAILIIPISLTGAALVWDEAIDRGLNPGRYAVSGQQTLGADAYVAAARRVIAPGERLVSLRFPEGLGPVIVQAASAGRGRGGPPQRTSVYLDPPTARVLATGNGCGLMRAFHQIHGSLMLPGAGRQIVGWVGVAMMLSAFTGLCGCGGQALAGGRAGFAGGGSPMSTPISTICSASGSRCRSSSCR